MQSGVASSRWERLSIMRLFPMMLALLSLSLLVLPALSLADDYLSELEAEAELSAAGAAEDNGRPSRSGAIGSPRQHSAEQLNFERVLQSERPHVHTFYKRLSDDEKMQVVSQYMKNSESLSKAANQVLDLYFQKK